MISSLNTACKLGESPVYHALENCAYWLDLNDRFIYQYDLSKKVITKLKNVSNAIPNATEPSN